MLKSYDFSVSPRPLGFRVLGLRVWGQGLTITFEFVRVSEFKTIYFLCITRAKYNITN